MDIVVDLEYDASAGADRRRGHGPVRPCRPATGLAITGLSGCLAAAFIAFGAGAGLVGALLPVPSRMVGTA